MILHLNKVSLEFLTFCCQRRFFHHCLWQDYNHGHTSWNTNKIQSDTKSPIEYKNNFPTIDKNFWFTIYNPKSFDFQRGFFFVCILSSFKFIIKSFYLRYILFSGKKSNKFTPKKLLSIACKKKKNKKETCQSKRNKISLF